MAYQTSIEDAVSTARGYVESIATHRGWDDEWTEYALGLVDDADPGWWTWGSDPETVLQELYDDLVYVSDNYSPPSGWGGLVDVVGNMLSSTISYESESVTFDDVSAAAAKTASEVADELAELGTGIVSWYPWIAGGVILAVGFYAVHKAS